MHGHGTVINRWPNQKPKKEMCKGCRDDFYNGRQNFTGDECWSFKSAQVVDKKGYRSLNSVNMDETKILTLGCWHAVSK